MDACAVAGAVSSVSSADDGVFLCPSSPVFYEVVRYVRIYIPEIELLNLWLLCIIGVAWYRRANLSVR